MPKPRPNQKQPGVGTSIYIRLGPDLEARNLFLALDEYKRIKGWTWRRFIFTGMAELIYEDNPVLASDLAEYIVQPTKDREVFHDQKNIKRKAQ